MPTADWNSSCGRNYLYLRSHVDMYIADRHRGRRDGRAAATGSDSGADRGVVREHDPSFRARPRHGGHGLHPGAGAAPTRSTMATVVEQLGYTPALGGRAPRHARRGQLRPGRAHRAPGQRHLDAAGRFRAASCSPTTPLSSWPSSSERSKPCTRGGSTSDLGRAPGTDQVTVPGAPPHQGSRQRRHLPRRRRRADQLPPARRGSPGPPVGRPGSGYLPEVWLLGSSLFSAQLAGMLGLPFSFAYHFAPKLLDAALETYRSNFRPSILHDEPRSHGRRHRAVCAHRGRGPLAVRLVGAEHPAAAYGTTGAPPLPRGRRGLSRSRRRRGRSSTKR